MKKSLIVAMFSAIVINGFAQSAEDSVKTAVNKLFTAMKSADGEMLKTCFADSAIIQTVAKNKEGKTFVRMENVAGFANYISTNGKGDVDERITLESVKMEADLASVWAPYNFYYKGSFKHCGVNSFQLVRLNGEWKIQYLIDTRRKSNCER